MTLTDSEVATVKANQCPVCKNWGFIPGPRGGAGQNIYCANPKCRAAFMVAPRQNIMLAERVGDAPEHYYPPQVHILWGGSALCNFAGSITINNGPPPRVLPTTPDMWPIGHWWVGREEFELATCKACRERARS
jgi:hypothetical protein